MGKKFTVSLHTWIKDKTMNMCTHTRSSVHTRSNVHTLYTWSILAASDQRHEPHLSKPMRDFEHIAVIWRDKSEYVLQYIVRQIVDVHICGFWVRNVQILEKYATT